jgi:putative ABC transport system permease protein
MKHDERRWWGRAPRFLRRPSGPGCVPEPRAIGETRTARHGLMLDLAGDTRLALRRARHSPRFYAAAALTLALGIGANGAVFSILSATLLQPLPYYEPSRLAMLWVSSPHATALPSQSRGAFARGLLSPEMVLAWRAQASPELGEMAAALTWQGSPEAQFDVTSGDRVNRLNGAFVTPNFFDVLGVRAALGRLFSAADERSNTPVVVLSYALWQQLLGGSSSVIGRPITLVTGRGDRRARSFVILGVLPRGVHFTYPEETQAWVMMPWTSVQAYPAQAIAFQAVTRLKAGITLDRAARRAKLFTVGLDFPGQKAEDRASIAVEPMHRWVIGETRPALELLGGVAALLLAVACFTSANGLLGRLAERQRDMSIRIALGASRFRLIRQLLTEGAILSFVGAALGIGIAVLVQPILRAWLPASVPEVGDIAVNGSFFEYGFGMACIATMLAAVVPAIGGTHSATGAAQMRAGTRATAARGAARWRQGLIGAQAAIATVLLVSATLLLTSFWHLGRVQLGFDGSEVLTVEMRLLGPKYRNALAIERFQDELLRRVRAIPGIAEVGLTSAVPFRGTDFMQQFSATDSVRSVANLRFVDPGYFEVLQMRLLSGRFFRSSDRSGAPRVVLVSESYARRAFGNANPIGRTVMYDALLEVVGVVADVRYASLDRDPNPALYIPLAQHPSNLLCVVARSRIGAAGVAPGVLRAIHDVDPSAPAMGLTTIDKIIDRSVSNRRFYTVATESFAAIALALTVIGLVGVVARTVTERRHELAIRAALGASTVHLGRVATQDVMIAAAVGIAVGATTSYSASFALAQFLFQVEPRWPVAYGLVVATVFVLGLVAAWAPVRTFQRLSLAALLRSQ